MEEEWRDIVIEKNGVLYDYSGLYQVSNLGKVRSLHYCGKGGIKVLKQNTTKGGYKTIPLQKNNDKQCFLVHRLVATMFIDNPNNLPEVNHKDEDKTNNHINNLEWMSKQDNIIYGTARQRTGEKLKGRKLSEQHKQKIKRSKKVICIETGQIFDTCKEAGEWCGVKRGCITNCCRGRSKTAGGYHWMYYDDYLRESK